MFIKSFQKGDSFHEKEVIRIDDFNGDGGVDISVSPLAYLK